MVYKPNLSILIVSLIEFYCVYLEFQEALHEVSEREGGGGGGGMGLMEVKCYLFTLHSNLWNHHIKNFYLCTE